MHKHDPTWKKMKKNEKNAEGTPLVCQNPADVVGGFPKPLRSVRGPHTNPSDLIGTPTQTPPIYSRSHKPRRSIRVSYKPRRSIRVSHKPRRSIRVSHKPRRSIRVSHKPRRSIRGFMREPPHKPIYSGDP